MAATAPTEDEEQEPKNDRDLPQVFGRYLLLKRLSRGGMGEIFLGRVGEIQGFEKPVIIKKVLPNLAADEEFVKRFIDEAQVAIKLNHANIASVFEVGKVDGDYFLALEYIEGRDIRRLLTRCRNQGTRPPPDICLFIAREIASGLGYAHRRTDTEGRALALVHCDISPPNVMVSFEGEVKVIDFGIAKSAIRIAGSNPNMGFGKFGYMAPEQLLRGGVVDRRTDIYAAGVVLYELLTGERMFMFPEGVDYRQIARMVTRGEFIPLSERDPRLNPGLDELVHRAVASHAEDRYQTAEEFRDAIQHKLYRMNPTISADTVAEFMRQQFSDEIAEERALVASAQTVDIDEFRDQLSGSVTHTVTYARAGLFGKRGTSSQPKSPAAAAEASASVHLVRKNGLIAVAFTAAMLGGGVLTYLIARRPPGPPVSAPPIAAAPTVTVPAIAPPPSVGVVPAPAAPVKPPAPNGPIVTPLVPSQSPAVARKEREPEPRIRKPLKVREAETPTSPSHSATGHSQDEVTAKFRSIKQEYNAFKGEYGPRLEGQWTNIVNEITFGRSDKFEKVDALLDALKRDMARVRKGT